MRDAEQALEKVFKGMGEVEAPAGMEDRILRAMARRAEQPVQTNWRRMWDLVPVSVAVAVCVAFVGLLWSTLRTAPSHRAAAGHTVSDLAVTRPHRPSEMASSPLRAVSVRFNKKVPPANPMSASDELALEEMRAPSQPAPPLPPTEQEQLLMRVALRHDPDQLAVLNPETRAKQELQAKVEFHDFFEPVRPAEENPSTTTVKEKGDTQ